ncbi:restriction endonuclease subunit S [Sphingomonas sp. TWP1-3-1]|uniref:restriction endonuclease subunit S n=1 Tax=Sphingomonas sp. TWP1-3-1 TaxID=2804612 RepID=UPI003CF18C12
MSFVADLTALVAASVDHRHCCPDGWSRVPLGSVAKIINGFPFKSSGFGDKGYPVIRIRDVTRGYTTTRFDGDAPDGFWVNAGDIIVGMDGDFQTAFWRSDRALLNQRVCKIVPDVSQIDRRYLAYILPGYLALINANTPSVTVKHLSSRTLASIPLPLPPLERQKCIADRIDELFAEVDDGEAALARARDDLATWRKALLKAAVSGELTANWRDANPASETGADLFARIIAERSQQRDAYRNGRDRQYLSSADVAGDGRSSLPGGWVWAHIGELFDVFVGATPSRSDSSLWDGDIPWVSSGEVGFCRISDTREKINRAALRGSTSRLHPPGTVMLGMIGEGKTRGQAAILDIEAAHNQNCASIRVSQTSIPPEYIYLVLAEQYERTRLSSSGGNQPALNKERVKAICIPLPGASECRAIAAIYDEASDAIDAFEAERVLIDSSVATLRQSILAAAFRGDLA